MELFSLFAKIALDSSDFDKGLSSASGLMQSFSGKVGAAISAVGKAAAVGLGAATTAAVAFGKSSVDAGMGFDSAMSQIAATLGMSVQDIQNNVGGAGDTFDMLRKKAMEMGASTNFSAKEAADGLNILAMSGYDAENSVSMIEDVLHLAAAGAMDMGNAAAYISGTMKGFNDATKDSGYYADLMAKGATLANTSVSQLGEAMSSGAAGAAAYHQSADSMTLSLLRLAEQGEVGSAAGTALAAAMKNIYMPTEQAKKALKELGVAAYENGKELDFNDVVNNLSAAFSKLSSEKANEYKQTIFGIQGQDAFNKLIVTGTEKQNEWAQALASASDGMGEAAKQYDTMTDNLQGDLDNLSSAWEGMQIVVSDQLTPAVREFVQFGTSGITAVTDAFKREEAVRGLSDAIRDAEGNLLSAGQVAGVLSETLYSMSESDRQIAIREIFNTDDMEYVNELLNENGENWGYLMGYVAEIDAASEATNGWAAAMGTLGPVVSDAVTMILEGLPQAVEVGGQLLGAVVTGVIGAIPALADGALQVAEAFGGLLLAAAPSMAEKGAELISFIGNGLSEGAPALTEKAAELAPALSQGLADGISSATGSVAEAVTSLAAIIGDNAPSLIDSGLQLLNGLVTGIMDGLPKLTESAGSLMESFGGYLRDNLPMLAETGLSMLEGLSGSIRENAGKLVDSGLEMLLNLAQGFADSIPAIIEHVPTIISNIAGVINDNAPKILAAGVSIILTIANGVVKAIPTLIANFPKIIKAIVDVWNAFNWLNLGKNAVNFIKNGITSLKTKIPEAFKTIANNSSKFFKSVDWASLGKTAVNFIVNGIRTLANAIPTALRNIATTAANWFKSVNWIQVGKDVINGIISGVVSMGKSAVDAVVGVGRSMLDGVKNLLGIASPSKEFAWIGQMIDEGLAKGVADNADKAESEAAKLAKSVFSAVSTEIERQTKYQALSLSDQLEMWREVQSKFAEGTDQWWSARDKVFDLEAKVASEQSQKIKDIYSGLVKDVEYAVKRYGISTAEQLDQYERIRDQFWRGSEEWLAADEKVFDLRQKLADEEKKLLQDRESAWEGYASKLKGVTETINGLESDYQKELSKRAGDIANSYKLFAEVPETEAVSAKDLFKNLRAQVDSIGSFYDNIRKLSERGVGSALVEEIRAMGVSASGELEALLSLSDKKLAQYAELYGEKQSLANSIAVDELSALRTETDDKIRESLESVAGLYDEYAPTIGASFAEGLAQGIRDGMQGALDAAAELADKLKAKFDDFAVNSFPSLPRASGEYGYYAAQQATVYAPAVTPALSAAPYSSGYQEPIQIEVKAEPAPLTIDGREFARVIYQYFVEETNRQGRQLIVT